MRMPPPNNNLAQSPEARRLSPHSMVKTVPSKNHTTVAKPLMGPQKAGLEKAVTCWARGGGGEWRLQPCPGLPGVGVGAPSSGSLIGLQQPVAQLDSLAGGFS